MEISAPPTVALFAASDAIIPSSDPLPNFSGLEDTFLATVYAITEPIEAPMPGNMPTNVPINEDSNKVDTVTV